MSVQKVFDELLVLQYRSGDKRALELLVKRHHTRLCRHAYWYTGDMDVAKDLVQDSWTTILQKINTLRDPKTFISWAMRIVTRKSLDFLNRNKRQSVSRRLRQHEYPPDDSKSAEESETGKVALALRLRRALEQLPENQKNVLRLFYTEEYSLKEIARILDISVGTVKSRLFHAREKLKLILNKDHEI